MLSWLSILVISSNIRLSSGADECCRCVNTMQMAWFINSCGIFGMGRRGWGEENNTKWEDLFFFSGIQSRISIYGNTWGNERAALKRINRNNKQKLVSLISKQAEKLFNELLLFFFSSCRCFYGNTFLNELNWTISI